MFPCNKCEKVIHDLSYDFCPFCNNNLEHSKDVYKKTRQILEQILKLYSMPMLIPSLILNKKELDHIPKIIMDVTSNMKPLAYVVYIGYLTRKMESELNNNFPRLKKNHSKIDNLIKKSVNNFDSLKDVADILDQSETLHLGPDSRQYIIWEIQDIETIIDGVLNVIINKDPILSCAFQSDENGEEIILRNVCYGYCLRLAYEIISNYNHS